MKTQSIGWKRAPLGHFCEVSRAIVDPTDLGGNEQYIGLEHIDGDTGNLSPVPAKQADLKSSKFSFCSTEILFGKLRPYLRKTARPSFPGVCSTDILPLKPNPARIDKDLLFYLLRRSEFVAQATARMSGANLPRISPDTLLSLEISVPVELAEQKRIVLVLDQCTSIIRKRREALRLADEFLRSVFLEMFGDPVTNSKNWESCDLDSICDEFRYGTSAKCSPQRSPGSLPVLRIPNINRGQISYDDLVFASLPDAEQSRLRLESGDLLFVRTNGNPEHIGRCAVFEETDEYLYASYLIRARLGQSAPVAPQFLHSVVSLPSFRHLIIRAATTTAGNYNINTTNLGKLRIPVPPKVLQEEYVRLKSNVKSLKTRLDLATLYAKSLFGSLSQRAFRGEL